MTFLRRTFPNGTRDILESCAAASRGGVGEKAAASFRAGSRAPEKRFPPQETPTERARRSPWKLSGAGRKPALS